MIVTNVYNERYEMIVPEKWAGFSVEYIFKHVFHAPKKITHQFRMEKLVFVNGVPANWTIPLQEGDHFQPQLFDEKPFPVVPNALPLDVIFEDEHLLVVNKRAGVVTHPNHPEETNTLANSVAYYLQQKGELRHVRHIHRLDEHTTGAVLFSKHPLAGAILDGMLAVKEIERTYLALVHGIMKKQSGTIELPIGRDRHHPTKRRVSPTGQEAKTTYTVLKVFPEKYMTYLQCQLVTGRTHQIRVHLSEIGHPLVGDTLYGGEALTSRQALHAVELKLLHPFTRQEINCSAPFIDEQPVFPSI